MNREKSRELFAQATAVIPGGVNSPVRAFRAVGGDPLFIERGEGAYLYDADGNRYLDCIGSWGPLVLGHAHPQIIAAIRAQLAQRNHVRRAHRAGSAAGADDLRGRAERGKSAAGLVRHGSDDERDPRGARLYGPR